MREIKVSDITETISRLFQEACYYLPEDVVAALKKAREEEESPMACYALDRILENTEFAAKEQIAICQDTGVAIVFLELGQEVHITGGDLYTAVNKGVSQGYINGYLRKSVVRQPILTRGLCYLIGGETHPG